MLIYLAIVLTTVLCVQVSYPGHSGPQWSVDDTSVETYHQVVFTTKVRVKTEFETNRPEEHVRKAQLTRLNDTISRLRIHLSSYKAECQHQLTRANGSLDRMRLAERECTKRVVEEARHVLTRAMAELKVCLRPAEEETNEAMRNFNRVTVELRNNRGSRTPDELDKLELRSIRLVDMANITVELCNREYAHELGRVLKFADRCGYLQQDVRNGTAHRPTMQRVK